MMSVKFYRTLSFLIGFPVGIYALLLLAAVIGISFEPYSEGKSPSLSVGSGNYQISLSGLVPHICRVSVTEKSNKNVGGLISLGQMDVFCSHDNGYKVRIDHSGAASGAAVIVDGHRVPLKPQGSTMMYASNGSGKSSHQLTLDVSNHPDPVGNLSFYVKPI